MQSLKIGVLALLGCLLWADVAEARFRLRKFLGRGSHNNHQERKETSTPDASDAEEEGEPHLTIEEAIIGVCIVVIFVIVVWLLFFGKTKEKPHSPYTDATPFYQPMQTLPQAAPLAPSPAFSHRPTFAAPTLGTPPTNSVCQGCQGQGVQWVPPGNGGALIPQRCTTCYGSGRLG